MPKGLIVLVDADNYLEIVKRNKQLSITYLQRKGHWSIDIDKIPEVEQDE